FLLGIWDGTAPGGTYFPLNLFVILSALMTASIWFIKLFATPYELFFRRYRPWFFAPLLLALLVLARTFNIPLRIGFLFSKSALEALVLPVSNGQVKSASGHVGIYRVEIEPDGL